MPTTSDHLADGSDNLLTSLEAADALGVSSRTIERWGKKGLLTVVRIGRKTRYHAHEIAAIRGGRNLSKAFAALGEGRR